MRQPSYVIKNPPPPAGKTASGFLGGSPDTARPKSVIRQYAVHKPFRALFQSASDGDTAGSPRLNARYVLGSDDLHASSCTVGNENLTQGHRSINPNRLDLLHHFKDLRLRNIALRLNGHSGDHSIINLDT